MLVIYIALVFILLGVAFFALSTKTERRSIPASQPLSSVSGQPVSPGGGSSSKSVEEPRAKTPVESSSAKIAVQEHVFYRETEEEARTMPVSGTDSSAVSEIPTQSAHYSPVQELQKTMDQAQAPVEDVSSSIDAVLFEDRDSVVSFGEGPDAVNPEVFSNLSRLSEGKLVLGPDSLTFRSEDTLYRFDFHRLKEIRGDAAAVLIFPDNMNHPLLIISPENSSLAKQILDLYINFKRERQRG